jgi:hypothetical protein
LRVFPEVLDGARDRRARAEITSPTDLFSICAISCAALSTSSSIVRVVRINSSSRIKHHTSDALPAANWSISGNFFKITQLPKFPNRSIFAMLAYRR